MSEVINAFASGISLDVSVCFFGKIVFEEFRKKDKFYNIFIFLCSSAFLSLISSYLTGTPKTILLSLIIFLTLKAMFNIETGKALFSTIIYSIAAIIPDLIVTTFFIYALVGKAYFYAHLAGSAICTVCVSILMILLIYVARKPLKKVVNFNPSTNKKIVFVSFLTLLSLAVFFYRLIKTFEFDDNILYYILVIITLILILLLLFKQKSDNENITKRYDDLLTVMKEYETDIEKQRSTMHENKNELMTIKSKINGREKEAEVLRYIDSIIGDKVTKGKTKYSKFKYLPSNGLKGFFYYKVLEAGEKDIDTTVNVSKQIENCFLKDLKTNDFKQLARLIGVYLDNAIEASAASDKKLLGIEVYLINGNAKIIISNTYANDINLDKMGKERYSTKGKNRGHGLLLVEMILSKSDIFEAKTKVTDELYIQELTIKNKTNKEKDAK